MKSLLTLSLLVVSTFAFGLDTMSCLSAKANFSQCAKRSETEEIPLRDCLAADSGYEACRAYGGPVVHKTCLPAKGQYKLCRDLAGESSTQVQCISADSGFRDCMGYENNILLCINTKGGYGPCRKANPHLGHLACSGADNGYADCLLAGGNHLLCIGARRSYKYCREVDRQSHVFCTRIGKGYMECRQAGYTVGICNLADHGFADCVKYKEP